VITPRFITVRRDIGSVTVAEAVTSRD